MQVEVTSSVGARGQCHIQYMYACVYMYVKVSLGVLGSCTNKGVGVCTFIHVRLLFAG